MNWLSGLSQQDKDEMYLDACEAFNGGRISEAEFRKTLGELGFNATDIQDCVKEHRPEGD